MEVEIKVSADLNEIKSRLLELGGEHLSTRNQRDTYYSAPHRDFAETDEAVRIRVDNGDAYLTYKGPKIDSRTKSREEFEVEVNDPREMDSILRSLGFEEFETVSKRREVYSLGEYEILLDDVKGLGEFVEVEREADEDEFDEAREGVIGIIEKLGIDPSESIRKSYLGLLLENG
ncbi:MAG: class IV adenylate cyclase [Halobacteria archaeon]|nr:class IV adenylate cyclase [Halobacteria archaeon]